MKWENINSLLNSAVLNNRITKKQAQFLKEKYCREENTHNNEKLQKYEKISKKSRFIFYYMII